MIIWSIYIPVYDQGNNNHLILVQMELQVKEIIILLNLFHHKSKMKCKRYIFQLLFSRDLF